MTYALPSRSKIDRAGKLLSDQGELTEEHLELEDVFDAYTNLR
jgi:hypothetical protein